MLKPLKQPDFEYNGYSVRIYPPSRTHPYTWIAIARKTTDKLYIVNSEAKTEKLTIESIKNKCRFST